MMKCLDNVLRIIADLSFSPKTEQVHFTMTDGRINARDVVSEIHMPQFNKSAMDGYACRMSDLTNLLDVIELIKPGQVPVNPIEANQCSKIMTGAMVPANADCVIMIEQTELVDRDRIRIVDARTKTNICLMGEDVKPGDLLISKGTRMKAQHVAILASAGRTSHMVFKKPRVGIITAGDELVEPQHIPQIPQIRNSNAYQLISQVNNSGCDAHYLRIVKDKKEILKNTLLNALANNDLLILTGGVSKGDSDFVPRILKEMDFEILFTKLAIKPGMPMILASKKGKFCVGLSGNPVSSFLQFELVVKPLLDKLTGCDEKSVYLKIPMGGEYSLKESDRVSYIPVRITHHGVLYPVEFHGSGHLHSLADANGIAHIKSGQNRIAKGTLLDVLLI